MLGALGSWYVSVEKKSAEVARLEAQIIEKTDTMARIAAARASLAQIADDETTIASYFVPETSVVSFITSLEDRAETLNTSLGVLSVEKAGTPSNPAFKFVLAIDGTFEAIMRTVGALEYAPYNLSIQSASISNVDENSWRGTIVLLVGSLAPKTATSTP